MQTFQVLPLFRAENSKDCRGTVQSTTRQVCVIGHKGVRALQLLHERVPALHYSQRAPIAHLWPHVLPWRCVYLHMRALRVSQRLSSHGRAA